MDGLPMLNDLLINLQKNDNIFNPTYI